MRPLAELLSLTRPGDVRPLVRHPQAALKRAERLEGTRDRVMRPKFGFIERRALKLRLIQRRALKLRMFEICPLKLGRQ